MYQLEKQQKKSYEQIKKITAMVEDMASSMEIMTRYVFVWCLCGVCVVFEWCLCGVCVVFEWCLCGVCVVFVWCVCGVCVVFV